MHRLNELVDKLTPQQLKEVEDFAEFLLTRQPDDRKASRPKFLDVDSFAGMFAGLAPEKTAVELADEAKEFIVKKHG